MWLNLATVSALGCLGGVESNASVRQLNELAIGVESTSRDGLGVETTASGTMARELYLFDADPRNTGDPLADVLDHRLACNQRKRLAWKACGSVAGRDNCKNTHPGFWIQKTCSSSHAKPRRTISGSVSAVWKTLPSRCTLVSPPNNSAISLGDTQ